LGIKRDIPKVNLNKIQKPTIFKNSQVVADPFALALHFSPFGIKHQNGIIFGPLTPLPHQKLSNKSKKGN
jgi:hypothetical protein